MLNEMISYFDMFTTPTQFTKKRGIFRGVFSLLLITSFIVWFLYIVIGEIQSRNLYNVIYLGRTSQDWKDIPYDYNVKTNIALDFYDNNCHLYAQYINENKVLTKEKLHVKHISGKKKYIYEFKTTVKNCSEVQQTAHNTFFEVEFLFSCPNSADYKPKLYNTTIESTNDIEILEVNILNQDKPYEKAYDVRPYDKINLSHDNSQALEESYYFNFNSIVDDYSLFHSNKVLKNEYVKDKLCEQHAKLFYNHIESQSYKKEMSEYDNFLEVPLKKLSFRLTGKVEVILRVYTKMETIIVNLLVLFFLAYILCDSCFYIIDFHSKNFKVINSFYDFKYRENKEKNRSNLSTNNPNTTNVSKEDIFSRNETSMNLNNANKLEDGLIKAKANARKKEEKFKFNLCDNFLFLICFKTKKTKLKYKLYNECRSHINYYFSPLFFLKTASFNEVLLSEFLANKNQKHYSAYINLDENDYDIEKSTENEILSNFRKNNLINNNRSFVTSLMS